MSSSYQPRVLHKNGKRPSTSLVPADETSQLIHILAEEAEIHEQAIELFRDSALHPTSPRIVNIQSNNEASLKKGDRPTSLIFAGTVIAAVIALIGNITVALINHNEDSPPEQVSCIQAFQAVKEAVDMGITDPDLLDNINPPAVDAACGTEVQIAQSLK